MFNRIKYTLITVSIFSAIAIGIWKLPTEIQHCRAVVLEDMLKHQQFGAELGQFVQTRDFLTELSRGK